MPVIQGSKDCGNSPKNQFVQDVSVALEGGDALSKAFSEDVTWEQPATQLISGKNALTDYLASRPKPASITVLHAISHGKVGAANGEVILANGQTRRFCHVFAFTNTKANCISAIKSYS
jgi:hypothetical protein